MSILLRQRSRRGRAASAPAGFLRWSALSTWGGSYPPAGVDLVLGAGTKILYDISMLDAAAPGIITVAAGAELKFDDTIDTRLICDGITNQGTITAGSLNTPHPTRVRIDLCGQMPTVSGNVGGGALIKGLTHNSTTDVATGNNGTTNDYGGIYRGFLNMAGGVLRLNGGFAPIPTRLNAAYTSGTSITVADFVTAPAGATVLVTPDGFYNASRRTEIRTLAVAATNTKTLTLNSALGFARWGQLQYYTDSGMSLSAGTFSTMRAHASQDPTIDERAFVIVLDPRIKVTGYDRSGRPADLASGFGMHGMSMGLTSETVLKNVGFENYGQLGLLGRYGWHFHIPSYNADGSSRTDGVGGTNGYATDKALLDGCSGLAGFNRFFTFHACVGVKATRCIAHDAAGHAFFEEDGSEMGNESSYNLSIGHRDPGASFRLKVHDVTPAGHWMANPNNTHRENWGIDSVGLPWWNAHSFGLIATRPSIQHGCLGFSANVPINPGFERMGVWDGNSGLGCDAAATSDNGPTTNAGNLNFVDKIKITTNGVAFATFTDAAETVLALNNARLFKCRGYSNQVSNPNYNLWRVADVFGTGLSGITNFGFADGLMVIRQTLNHESNALNAFMSCGFVPYHGTMGFKNITADGFNQSIYTTNGGNHGAVQKQCLMQNWEEYTQAVQNWSVGNTNWKLRNCDVIWQVPASHLTEATTTYDAITGVAAGGPKYILAGGTDQRAWTLGALYDHFGYLSQGPTQAGVPCSHICWNHTFWTTGTTSPTALEDNPQSVVTTTPFMGITQALGARNDMPQRWQRTDSSGNNIVGAMIEVPAWTNSVLRFRMASIPVGGFVKWSFPGQTLPIDLGGNYYCAGTQGNAGNGFPATNTNLNETTAVTYWGIEWGAGTAQFACAGQTYDQTGITSLATLVASSGYKFWHDVANSIVWVRLRYHRINYQWTLTP